MKIPKQIVIGDEIWDIVLKGRIGSSRKTLGLCDPSTQTISIRKGQTSFEILDTLFHETIHAFEEVYGIKIRHELVYRMGTCLARLMVDNFGLEVEE